MWLGKLTGLDMTPLGGMGRKTSAQTNQQDKAAFTQSERAMTEKERTNVFNSNAVFDTNDGLKGMESRHLVFIPTIFGVT